VGAQAMNWQFGVENFVSGKYDRVTVSTNLQAAVAEHRKQKAKKERRILCLRSESSWYYSIFLCQLDRKTKLDPKMENRLSPALSSPLQLHRHHDDNRGMARARLSFPIPRTPAPVHL
jgi:hypothetical protein